MKQFTPPEIAKAFVLISFSALTALAAAPAQAVVISFEGASNTQYNNPITRSGFDIGNPIGQEQHFHEIDSTQFSLPNNGTGVLLNDRDTDIFVIANAGAGFSQFSLTSVDVAASLGNQPANDIRITGFLNNVQTGSLLVSPLGTGYTTIAGASFGIIDRLVFDGIGGSGGFVLDNLALNNAPTTSVPEPFTVLGTIFGAGYGVSLKRKLAKAKQDKEDIS
jgi:hypothetical protein